MRMPSGIACINAAQDLIAFSIAAKLLNQGAVCCVDLLRPNVQRWAQLQMRVERVESLANNTASTALIYGQLLHD